MPKKIKSKSTKQAKKISNSSLKKRGGRSQSGVGTELRNRCGHPPTSYGGGGGNI